MSGLHGFGELEVTALEEKEDLIGLVDEDWYLSARAPHTEYRIYNPVSS